MYRYRRRDARSVYRRGKVRPPPPAYRMGCVNVATLRVKVMGTHRRVSWLVKRGHLCLLAIRNLLNKILSTFKYSSR